MKLLDFFRQAMASVIQFAGKKRCSPFPRVFNHLLRLVHDWVQKAVNNGSLQDPHHTWVLNNKDLPDAYGVSGGFIRRGLNDDS